MRPTIRKFTCETKTDLASTKLINSHLEILKITPRIKNAYS